MAKKRILLGLCLVFLVFAGLVAAQQSISGSVTVSNVAPTVSAITPSTTTVTPGQYFTITVTVSDDNSLNDINKVQIVVYSSSVLQGDADNARNHYTFTWDKTNGWAGSPAGYIDTTGSSIPADLSATSGDWIFRIKLDETAEATTWTIYAYVEDASAESASSTSTSAFSVNVYISFSLDDTALSFSGTPGSLDVQAAENPTVVTITSNVNVNINVYGSGDWTGQTYGQTIPLANLEAAQDGTKTGAITLSTAAQALYTAVPYGKGVTKNIYWFLDIPTGLRADTYTVTLYVDVTQA